MAYVRKTEDEYAIFANYGSGWEEETIERSFRDVREQLKAYRQSAPQYSYKYVKRRVPIVPKNEE